MNKSNEDRLREIERQFDQNTRDLQKEFVLEIAIAAETPQLVEWEAQRQIFSVRYEGRTLYPAFQFGEDGRPLPILARVLEILGKDRDRTRWEDAFWFFSASGWLCGETPIECVEKDPQAVVFAAEQAVAGTSGAEIRVVRR